MKKTAKNKTLAEHFEREVIAHTLTALDCPCCGEHSLCADETRIQVLDEGDNPSSNSFMWVYRSNVVSQEPVVIYDYQAGRSRACAQEFLVGYQGYLQCDGYRVYDGIEGIIPVGCWAHARRKYDEALKAESKNKGRAHKAISFISQLYKLKTQANTVSVTTRKSLTHLNAIQSLA